MIDLRHTPSQQHDHEVLENKESDAEEIESRIDRAVEDDDLNGEAIDEAGPKAISEVTDTARS